MPNKGRIETDNRIVIEELETAHSRLVASTVLVDLRRRPRYDTRFPGEAASATGHRAYVMITNLSLSGLRFEAAEPNLASLLRVTSPGGEHHPVSLTLSFAVPRLPAQPGDIRVRCKTVYAHRGRHGSCQVGVRFTTFDEGQEALAGYIAVREADR